MGEIEGRLCWSDTGSSSNILGNMVTQAEDIDAKLECL